MLGPTHQTCLAKNSASGGSEKKHVQQTKFCYIVWVDIGNVQNVEHWVGLKNVNQMTKRMLMLRLLLTWSGKRICRPSTEVSSSAENCSLAKKD